MNLYAFELGRKKDLCFAELLAVLGEEALVERNLDSAIFEIPEIEPESLQDRLGGTIKIVKIFAETSKSGIEPTIREHLDTTFKDRSGKIPFSVSLLSFKNQREINIKKLLNFSKIFLKSLGLNSRFVNKGPISPKPSTIFKARVIEKGIDINIIKGSKNIFVGETVAIQNIDEYSKRDYFKPLRDARVGMLPPKLAQIMINLAGLVTNPDHIQTIYDPFCGTGTVPMEGLLMGKNVIGSDIDPRMVEYSKKNLSWLEYEFSKKIDPKLKSRIFERDARFINGKCLPEKIDAIVTESYLGGPQTGTPSPEVREKIFRELANLHLNWLKAVNPFLKKGARVVMCITAFLTKTGIEYFPKFKEIAENAGFRIVGTFTYDRPDQIVIRDIKILERL